MVFAGVDLAINDTRIVPAHHFQFDRWNNVTVETNTLGYATNNDYDSLNHLITRSLPEIEVILPNDQTTRTRPTTNFYHNILGFTEGKQNAIGYITIYDVNERGLRLSEKLADQCYARRSAHDALGREYKYWDAREYGWLIGYNHNDKQISLLSPHGRTTASLYDELGHLRLNNVGNLGNYLENYNASENLITRILPMGETYLMNWDHNNVLMNVTMPNGEGQLSWTLNFFGVASDHTDLSGNRFNYGYDLKSQKITERGTNQKSLDYIYTADLLTKITDNYLNQTTLYGHDTEGRTILRQIDGYVIYPLDVLHGAQPFSRVNRTAFNEAGYENQLIDSDLTMNVQIDAEGNRRHIQTLIYTNPIQPLQQDEWNTFDCVNRILNEGNLVYGYQDNLRHTETQGFLPRTLDYDEDGLVLSSKINDKNYFTRKYDPASRATEITSVTNTAVLKKSTFEGTSYNNNSWTTGSSSTQKTTIINFPTQTTLAVTNYSGPYTSDGKATHGVTHFHQDGEKDDVVDSITNKFVGQESLEKKEIQGVRTYKKNTDHSTTTITYNPSNQLYIAFTQNGILWERAWSYLLLTADGLPLQKTSYESHVDPHDPFKVSSILQQLSYYYTTNGQPLGSRITFKSETHNEDKESISLHTLLDPKNKSSSFNPNFNSAVKHSSVVNKGVAYSSHNNTKQDPLIRDITNKVDLKKLLHQFDFKLEKMTQETSLSYPPPLPSRMTVNAGDTYETIAARAHVPEHAKDIEMANNSRPLVEGADVIIPQFIINHNRAGDYPNYTIFIEQVLKHLGPNLITPLPKQDDPDFLGVFIGVVAIAITLAVAPELALYVLPEGAALASSATGALVTGVMAGLTDAALQEVAIGVGLEKHFSVNDVIETAITAGTMTYAGLLGPGAPTTVTAAAAKAGSYALSAAASSVSSQLFEMKVGTRKEFDFKAVVTAVASSYIGTKLGAVIPGQVRSTIEEEVEQAVTSTVLSTGISSVLYQQEPNLEIMAAQTLGTIAGQEAGGVISNGLKSLRVSNVQRNNVDMDELEEKEHAAWKKQKAANKAMENKLEMKRIAAEFNTDIDVYDQNWINDLSEINRNGIKDLSGSVSVIKEANTSIHSSSTLKENVYKKALLLAGLAGANEIAQALGDRNPTNTIKNLAVMEWDGLNAISELLTGYTTEGARLRNIQMGAATHNGIDNFIKATGPERLVMLTKIGSPFALGLFAGSIAKISTLNALLTEGESIGVNAAGLASKARFWSPSKAGSSLKASLGEVNTFGPEDVANKILLTNKSSMLDPEVVKLFADKVIKNPITARTYQNLQSHGTNLILDFSNDVDRTLMGAAYKTDNLVEIYLNNHANVNEVLSTFVHEGAHMERFYKGFKLSTQYEEYFAVRREFLFNNGYRPSLAIRQQMWNDIQKAYSDIPLGKTPTPSW